MLQAKRLPIAILRPLTRLLQTQIKPKVVSTDQSTDAIPVFRKAVNFTDKIALRDDVGAYTYGNLFMAAKELSKEISQHLEGKVNEKVMFLCPNDATYVLSQWASWMSGQIGMIFVFFKY